MAADVRRDDPLFKKVTTSLHLAFHSSGHFREVGFAELATELRSLRVIDFEPRRLAPYIGRLPGVRSIALSHVAEPDMAGVGLVARLVDGARDTLERLELNRIPLGIVSDALATLFDAIGNCTRLQRLQLFFARLNDSHIGMLATLMTRLTQLTYLDLRWNDFQPGGRKKLTAAAKSDPTRQLTLVLI